LCYKRATKWSGNLSKPDRYLRKRHGKWHYYRRVPKRYEPFDARETIRASLKTDSLEVARFRRDALEAADDDYWASMLLLQEQDIGGASGAQYRETLSRRYRSANSRAIAKGFVYSPLEQLVAQPDIGELLDRLSALNPSDRGKASRREQKEAEALLGAIDVPSVTITEAFDIYCDEIAVGDYLNKSPKQKKMWLKTKRRSVQYFAQVVGDKLMDEITREDGLKYHKWCLGRLMPKDGSNGLKPNTLNRDLGNLRVLYGAYFKHLGDEDRRNPFRGLNFKDDAQQSRKNSTPPFETSWVRSKILVPNLFTDLNEQARLIIFALIETGCRPSEIANLKAEHIRLDDPVPHIRIAPTNAREIKTHSSIRDIPLVGVSFEAMRRAPDGFPHYYDRNDLLSQSLMKAFKVRGLFPTPKHRIYSFRHSFEKRMIEAGIDTELRKTLMGHSDDRPKYGDGGAKSFRRDQLQKIVHPFSPDVLD